jgi:hypothetical protein
MIVPITLLTAATVVGMALSALQAMTGGGVHRRRRHAPARGCTPSAPWSLQQASLMAMRRARPTPRPVPRRAVPVEAPTGS